MNEVQEIEISEYYKYVKSLFDEGYEMMVDLTAVDSVSYTHLTLPTILRV